MKVEITNKEEILTVTIDGILHLLMIGKCDAIHSFIDEKSDGGNKWMMYYINFHLATGSVVHCEYNRRDLWEQILKGL